MCECGWGCWGRGNGSEAGESGGKTDKETLLVQ